MSKLGCAMAGAVTVGILGPPLMELCRQGAWTLAAAVVLGVPLGVIYSLAEHNEQRSSAQRRAMREDCRSKGL